MKRRLTLAALAFFALPALAVFEVGDSVTNLCWKNVEDKTICMDDYKNTVRVLLYNAGWCGPCNSEFQELVPRVGEFEGKPVVFISLSASGWSQGSAPSTQFLKEWQKKHKIPFQVAGSPKDAGKLFIAPPIYIPNVAIVGQDGKLTYKAINPGVEAIFSKIRKSLKTR